MKHKFIKLIRLRNIGLIIVGWLRRMPAEGYLLRIAQYTKAGISVILIATFTFQPFGFAQGKNLAWGTTKGEGVSTGVDHDPTSLSPGQNLRPMAAEERLEETVTGLIKKLQDQDEFARAAAARDLGKVSIFHDEPALHIELINKVAVVLVERVCEDTEDMVAETAVASAAELIMLAEGKIDPQVEMDLVYAVSENRISEPVKKAVLRAEKKIRAAILPAPNLQEVARSSLLEFLYSSHDPELDDLAIEVLGDFGGRSLEGVGEPDKEIAIILRDIAGLAKRRSLNVPLISSPAARLEAISGLTKICEKVLGYLEASASKEKFCEAYGAGINIVETAQKCFLSILDDKNRTAFTEMKSVREKAMEGCRIISDRLFPLIGRIREDVGLRSAEDSARIVQACRSAQAASAVPSEAGTAALPNGYRTPSALKAHVDKLIKKLNSKQTYESIPAARELCSLREFEIGLRALGPKSKIAIQYKAEAQRAAEALKGCLEGIINADLDEVALIGVECARAIGELGKVCPLGPGVENAMARFLGEPRENYDPEIRKEIIRALGDMRHLSSAITANQYSVIEHLVDELLRAPGRDVETQLSVVRALGNIGNMAVREWEQQDFDNTFDVLVKIFKDTEIPGDIQIGEGPARSEESDYPEKRSPSARQEAIRTAVGMFITAPETVRKHAIRYTVNLDEKRKRLCSSLYYILDGSVRDAYDEDEDVRHEAARGLAQVFECWNDLLDALAPGALKDIRFDTQQCEKTMARDMVGILCGDEYLIPEKSPLVQAALLDFITKFWRVGILPGAEKLVSLIALSEDEDVRDAAALVITRFGSQSARAKLERLQNPRSVLEAI
jgi:HEAT repeat protein